MADVLTPLTGLDRDISEAYLDLLDAREAYAYSPNADNERTRDYAELRMNRLLERRYAAR